MPDISVYDSIAVVDIDTVDRRAVWNNAASVALNYGALNVASAGLEATWQSGSDYYIVNEVNTVPPFQVDFTFNDIPAIDSIALRLIGYYKGNPSHIVKIYVYNYNTSGWDAVTSDTKDLTSATSDQTYNFTIAALNHIQSGTLVIRIQHNSSYAANHFLYVNWLYLVHTDEVSVTDSSTVSESVTVRTDNNISVYDSSIISELVLLILPDLYLSVYSSTLIEEYIVIAKDIPLYIHDGITVADSVTADLAWSTGMLYLFTTQLMPVLVSTIMVPEIYISLITPKLEITHDS